MENAGYLGKLILDSNCINVTQCIELGHIIISIGLLRVIKFLYSSDAYDD